MLRIFTALSVLWPCVFAIDSMMCLLILFASFQEFSDATMEARRYCAIHTDASASNSSKSTSPPQTDRLPSRSQPAPHLSTSSSINIKKMTDGIISKLQDTLGVMFFIMQVRQGRRMIMRKEISEADFVTSAIFPCSRHHAASAISKARCAMCFVVRFPFTLNTISLNLGPRFWKNQLRHHAWKQEIQHLCLGYRWTATNHQERCRPHGRCQTRRQLVYQYRTTQAPLPSSFIEKAGTVALQCAKG